MRRNLTRRERLKAKADLLRVFTGAASIETKGFKLLYIENALPWNRIAVCPVRGFHRAVDRNRQKRACREAYRQLKERIRPGHDLAFVLYPGDYGFHDRYGQLQTVLQRAGLSR
jgi:ribonuclease P protein component